MKKILIAVLALLILFMPIPIITYTINNIPENEIESEPEPVTILVLPSPIIVRRLNIFIEEEPEISTEEKIENKTEEIIEEVEIEVEEIREVEYPTAEFIWNYLKDLGYNDYICAGIIGNMMVEAGGLTLNIQEDALSSGYYGICQWSKKYYPSVIGLSLDAQCDHLRDTIQYELNTFGYIYYKGFNYDSFLALENERDVALAFAKCYERCGSGSYTARQNCATTAYNYFTNLE